MSLTQILAKKTVFVQALFNRVNLCEWVAEIKRFAKYTNVTMNVLTYEKFRKERTVK